MVQNTVQTSKQTVRYLKQYKELEARCLDITGRYRNALSARRKGVRNAVFPKKSDLIWLNNLLRFYPVMWSRLFIPAAARDIPGWFAHEVQDLFLTVTLATGNRHGALLAPRGFAKSTMGWTFTLHGICYGNFYPKGYTNMTYEDDTKRIANIGLIGKDIHLAADNLEPIRTELTENEMLINLYGEFSSVRSVDNEFQSTTKRLRDTSQEVTYVHKSVIEGEETVHGTVHIFCKGSGQSFRGTRYLSQRPTLIITDDVDGQEGAENTVRDSDAMLKKQEWFETVVLPALDDHDGKSFTMGTQLKKGCLANYLYMKALREMKNKGAKSKWFGRKFSAIVYRNGKEESLWEEKRSLEDLRDLRDTLEQSGKLYSWFTEFMNEKISILGAEKITWDMFQYHDYRAIREGDHWELTDGYKRFPVRITIGYDLGGFEEKRGLDYTAIAVLARDEFNYYWLELHNFRKSTEKTMEFLFDTAKRWQVRRLFTETNSQKVFNDMLASRSLNSDYALRVSAIPLSRMTGGKGDRVMTMQPTFEAKRQFFPRNNENSELFFGQLVDIDEGIPHDDGADAIWHAQRNSKPVRVVNWEQSKSVVQFDNDKIVERSGDKSFNNIDEEIRVGFWAR